MALQSCWRGGKGGEEHAKAQVCIPRKKKEEERKEMMAVWMSNELRAHNVHLLLSLPHLFFLDNVRSLQTRTRGWYRSKAPSGSIVDTRRSCSSSPDGFNSICSSLLLPSSSSSSRRISLTFNALLSHSQQHPTPLALFVNSQLSSSRQSGPTSKDSEL